MSEKSNPYLTVISASFGIFVVINFLTKLGIPSAVKNTKRNPQETRWKWRNILTSFVHSSIAGIWTILVFVLEPSLSEDMLNSYSEYAQTLVCFSIGYFIYDFIDMAMYHLKGSTYELLLHHIMLIICYGMTVANKTYVAYSALSLLVEVNSIFLHARQLLIFAGFQKTSQTYR